jgi:CSLREA domain-containing protein
MNHSPPTICVHTGFDYNHTGWYKCLYRHSPDANPTTLRRNQMQFRKRSVCLAIGLSLGVLLGMLWLLSAAWIHPARAAVITSVNTTVDEYNTGGSCSLREAIASANTDTAVGGCTAGSGADTIILPANTYPLSLAGVGDDANLTGDLDITDTLTIIGAGPGQTIIDGLHLDRVLHIHFGVDSVVISGVTIYNGYAFQDSGGGINNWNADLTLINTEVLSNAAWFSTGAVVGGGLYHSDGNLTMVNCSVMSNTIEGRGGGIFLGWGTAVLTDTVISHNSANQTGGVLGGGGLYIREAHVRMVDGQVAHNSAEQDGGGVFVRESAASFTQTGDTLIAYNSADYLGGGVYVNLGSATIGSAQILSNTARSGGGVFVNGGSAVLSGTSVVSNTSQVNGGGLGTIAGSITAQGTRILANTTDGDGGGIDNAGFVTITSSVLAGNMADDGGGIANAGAMSVTNTTLSGNSAIGPGSDGGAVWSESGGYLTMVHTSIVSNTATRNGPGFLIFDGVVRLQNTIVANNGITSCYGLAPVSLGNNLDDGNSCSLESSTDITNTAALVSPLVAEGGTLLHRILPGSPAINTGTCVAGITVDQRGVARPQGPECDIGAFELILNEVYLPLVVRNY